MRPVALLQHDQNQGPGYLLQYLNEMGIPSVTFHPEDGDDVPRSAREFSGLVLLGSQRSVNDRLDWIDDEIALTQDAMAANIPVLGHCFGGQLMSKSLGGTVRRNPIANIGWSRLRVTPHARSLFNNKEITTFNWHYETFSIPRGAQRILFGAHCINKGFSIGKHLAFQCHFEVTEDIVRNWCHDSCAELETATGPAVQCCEDILSDLPQSLPSLQHAARQVYRHWTAQLSRQTSIYFPGHWPSPPPTLSPMRLHQHCIHD